eukprot:4212712-Pleurochrysis_carterae.AAC.3
MATVGNIWQSRHCTDEKCDVSLPRRQQHRLSLSPESLPDCFRETMCLFIMAKDGAVVARLTQSSDGMVSIRVSSGMLS